MPCFWFNWGHHLNTRLQSWEENIRLLICFLLPAARSHALSPWESSVVDRLMTPTLSFLARSRSAASVLNGRDGRKLRKQTNINSASCFTLNPLNTLLPPHPPTDSPLCPRSASASPLTLCAHQPHHRCSDHWRVTSSTPDIAQRHHRRSSTPVSQECSQCSVEGWRFLIGLLYKTWPLTSSFPVLQQPVVNVVSVFITTGILFLKRKGRNVLSRNSISILLSYR